MCNFTIFKQYKLSSKFYLMKQYFNNVVQIKTKILNMIKQVYFSISNNCNK